MAISPPSEIPYSYYCPNSLTQEFQKTGDIYEALYMSIKIENPQENPEREAQGN